MDIANARVRGSCSLLKGIDDSVGINGIRGISTSWPVPSPVMMTVFTQFGIMPVMTSLVPLQSRGGSKKKGIFSVFEDYVFKKYFILCTKLTHVPH